jgi:hypothetical protein
MSDTIASEPAEGVEEAGDGASSQKRLLLIVGGLAGLLVVALAAYFLFLSGGGEEDLGTLPPPAPASTNDGKQGDKEDDGDPKDQSLPEEFDGEVGSDPFKPLSVEAVVEPATADVEPAEVPSTPTTGGGVTNNPPVTQPTTQPTQPSPAPTGNPNPPDNDDPTVTKYNVTLKSINVQKNSAVIQVNGKRYVVKLEKMFPSSNQGPFKLIKVAELPSGKDSATVRFGSDAPVELVHDHKTVFKL